MESILKLVSNISNITDSTKDIQVYLKNTNIDKNMIDFNSPSLKQGTKFNDIQSQTLDNSNQLSKTNNKKNSLVEGFDNNDYNGLSSQTKTIIDNSKSTLDQINSYNSLMQEYKDKYKQYIDLQKQIWRHENINPPDNLKNKNISFTDTTTHITNRMYVTNKGVAKWYTDDATFTTNSGKNGCPDNTNTISMTIPWNDSYKNPGVVINIDSSHNLLTGEPMISGQSCGNEGNKVYVDKLIPNGLTPTYTGCFLDSSTNGITFIGGSPSTNQNIIQNGDFRQPLKISQAQLIISPYYKIINSNSDVPGWTFWATLINSNDSTWKYKTPFPLDPSSQCVSFSNVQYISQSVYLNSDTSYNLTFSACGNMSPNTINVLLSNKNIYSCTPSNNTWASYSTTIKVKNSNTYTIKFQGTGSSSNASAIQNIQLISASSSKVGSYTFDQCKNAAIAGGYQYFGLNDVSNNVGFCAVSNSAPIQPVVDTGHCISLTNPNDKLGGETSYNAIYNIGAQGYKQNIGQLGFVDQNNEIHNFPSTSIKFTNTYTLFPNIISNGNDLQDMSANNMNTCKTVCDNSANCVGYVYDMSDNKCYLKNSNMFTNGDFQLASSNFTTYLKNIDFSGNVSDFSGNPVNIDSSTYQSYKNGGEYLSRDSQNNKLDELKTQLAKLSQQINNYTNKYNDNAISAVNQYKKNHDRITELDNNYKNILNQINDDKTNMNNILSDSDIEILQKNYDYLFWTIIAIGTVLVTMNIVKK